MQNCSRNLHSEHFGPVPVAQDTWLMHPNVTEIYPAEQLSFWRPIQLESVWGTLTRTAFDAVFHLPQDADAFTDRPLILPWLFRSQAHNTTIRLRYRGSMARKVRGMIWSTTR